MGFTKEARDKLPDHYGTTDLDTVLGNHLLKLGSDIGFFTEIGDNRVQDVFGVVWDRTIDKDIGNVEGCVLSDPSLDGYRFPNPSIRGFLRTSPRRSPGLAIGFACFSSGFPSTNGPGRCAAWRSC